MPVWRRLEEGEDTWVDHPLTVLGHHPGQRGVLVRLEVLRLGLLASGHAAAAAGGAAAAAAGGVAAGAGGAASAFALRDASAFCRDIGGERMNQHARPKRKKKKTTKTLTTDVEITLRMVIIQ